MAAPAAVAPWAAWTGELSSLPAVVVNAYKSYDRLKRAESTWGPWLPRLERLPAHVPSITDVVADLRIAPVLRRRLWTHDSRDAHYELDTTGGVGCYLSHVAAWQHQVRNQLPLMLVLEDACSFDPERDMPQVRALLQAPTPLTACCVLKLGTRGETAGCEPVPGFPGWTRNSAVGAFAYVLTLDAATTLLEGCFPIEMHVDWYMGARCAQGKLAIFSHDALPLGRDYSFASVIGHRSPRYFATGPLSQALGQGRTLPVCIQQQRPVSSAMVATALLVVECVVIGLCAGLLWLVVRRRPSE
jgi:hypothetical protein